MSRVRRAVAIQSRSALTGLDMRPSTTLDSYLARRLGPGSGRVMALNMVTRSFTAPSLRSFWRYWNAGTNYFLLFYCYRRLRRFLSDGLALLLTFAICGLAHDVTFVLPASLMDGNGVPFPFITVWFLVIGACVLVADRFRLSFEGYSPWQRSAVHTVFLLATFFATFYIDQLADLHGALFDLR